MLIYLKLGEIHLNTYPLRAEYFSEEEEFEYDFLVIKRRVLHNYLVEEVLEKVGQDDMLKILEILLISKFLNFSQEIQTKLEIGFALIFERYNLVEMFKIVLMMS